jgi:glycine oxidase
LTARPAHVEYAVLGGGVAGLALAWRLARLGHPPLLLRGSAPAASPVAAGMLSPNPEMNLAPGVGRLAAESLREYARFLTELAEDTDRDPGFRRSGLLRVAFSDAEATGLREEVGRYEAAGMPTRWLSARATREEEPGLGASVVGGLLSYDEAQVQPAWMLAALTEALVRRGGRVVEEDVVDVVVPDRGGVEVRTGSGWNLLADRVVVSIGAWSGGLPGLAYPVRPVKGQLLVFDHVKGPGRVVYWGHNYLLSKPDGTVVLGGTIEEAGFDTQPTARADDVRGLLPRLWPALVDATAVTRVGLRPAAPDSLPVAGWLPELPAAYMFTAHFRNGFLFSPLASRLAADEIVTGVEAELLRRFRPARLRPDGEIG